MNSDFSEPRQRSWEDYWEIAKRRRWWILGPAFAVWALALGISWFIPAQYKSETVILVEQPKVPSQYVTPNVAVDLQMRLQTLSEQILSRTRLLRIVADLGLYKRTPNDSEAIVRRMRKDIKLELTSAPGQSELTGFKISYTAANPVTAQQVTGRLSSLFIDENLLKQQELSEDTTKFLEAELETARKDLEHQEAQLKDYRSRFLGELPEQLQGNMQILSGLQSRLDVANQALSHAEQQKVYLTSLLQQYKLPERTSGESALLSVDQRLETLKAQLADASARYTPKHPDVVHLKEQIAVVEELKRRIEKEPVPSDSNSTSSDKTSAPVAQLTSQLQATETEIASRRREIKDLERQIGEYQVRLNLAPVREQQLSALTRNYNQSRTNYESLLSKKLQSQMATNLEKRQQGEQFRILDPPSLPQQPSFPKRWMFALGGLAAGLFIGLLTVGGMETFDARVISEQEIVDLGTVVLGTVPPILTSREQSTRARRKRVEYALASAMLTLVPVLTLLTFLKG